jgi:hypothetical protein
MAEDYGPEISRDSALQDTSRTALSKQEQADADELNNTLIIGAEDGADVQSSDQSPFKQMASLNTNDTYSGTSRPPAKDETAKADELARALTSGLPGDPNGLENIHPEYEQIAFVLPLLWGGAVAAAEVVAWLGTIYGAAKVYEMTGGLSKTVGSVKDLGRTKTPNPPRKGPMPIPPGMSQAQSKTYYRSLGQDLVDLWTEPLYSRGNETTRRGNDIIAQECDDILEKEFPELLGKIDHIGGANFQGDGESKLKEWTLKNRKTGMKGRSQT